MVDAFISVRTKSTRLNEKCFSNIGGMSVLMGVVYRCISHDINPIITTTYYDHAIQKFAESGGIKCFAGPDVDRVGRWLGACKKFSVKKFVTVDCDDPLFDPEMAHIAYAAIDKDKIIKPNEEYYLGSNGWAFDTEKLLEVWSSKHNTKIDYTDSFRGAPSATEHVTSTVDKRMVQCVTSGEVSNIESRLRLTLDYIEDIAVISAFIRKLGWLTPREEIIKYAESNPGLLLANEFRIADWKKHAE